MARRQEHAEGHRVRRAPAHEADPAHEEEVEQILEQVKTVAAEAE